MTRAEIEAALKEAQGSSRAEWGSDTEGGIAEREPGDGEYATGHYVLEGGRIDYSDRVAIIAAHNAVPALGAEALRLKALLADLEWSAVDGAAENPVCPCCGRYPPDSESMWAKDKRGHKPDCALAAALK